MKNGQDKQQFQHSNDSVAGEVYLYKRTLLFLQKPIKKLPARAVGFSYLVPQGLLIYYREHCPVRDIANAIEH